jgi:hypothetical protein
MAEQEWWQNMEWQTTLAALISSRDFTYLTLDYVVVFSKFFPVYYFLCHITNILSPIILSSTMVTLIFSPYTPTTTIKYYHSTIFIIY